MDGLPPPPEFPPPVEGGGLGGPGCVGGGWGAGFGLRGVVSWLKASFTSRSVAQQLWALRAGSGKKGRVVNTLATTSPARTRQLDKILCQIERIKRDCAVGQRP